MTAASDPALAALQCYRALHAEWSRLCMELDDAGGNLPRLPPGRREAALAIMSARIACAEDAMNAAAERVTATRPTTAAGAAALIRHVTEDMEVHEDSDTSAWPVSLLFVAAEALDGIAASPSAG